MRKFNFPKVIAAFLLASLLLLTACSSAPPSRFDQAQKVSTQRGAKAVDKKAHKGGDFNKFFPKNAQGYKVIFAQEKAGFAQAKLRDKDGKEAAVLSVFDVSSNSTATNKYANSQETLKGYPLVNTGSTMSSILVDDRFQVKIQSKNKSFTEKDRKNWLGKFNLKGLAALK